MPSSVQHRSHGNKKSAMKRHRACCVHARAQNQASLISLLPGFVPRIGAGALL